MCIAARFLPTQTYQYRLLSSRVKHREFVSFVHSRERAHRLRFFAFAALLPPAALLGVLPAPNIWLAFCVWRALSHYWAWKGAENIENVTVSTESCTILGTNPSANNPADFATSSLSDSGSVPSALSKDTLANVSDAIMQYYTRLQEELQVPDLAEFVARARRHM